jgi:hypothetical protein
MKNLIDYSTEAYLQLSRLKAAATDPDEVERAVEQLELCLRWYDPRLDPYNTMNCGPLSGPGLLPPPHYTALMIKVPPLKLYFMVDDAVHPFMMTVVRVEWVLGVVDPDNP